MRRGPTRELLFAAVHPPGRVPSQRFRYEQYVDYLAEHGFRTTFAPILRPGDYAIVYGDRHYARKGVIAAQELVRRSRHLRRLSEYDIVFVQREAVQLGTGWFERSVSRSRAKLVFDFDDAIWLQNASDANRRLAWLKNPAKTAELISMADLVLAGNAYLADYASKFSNAVEIVPTTIDTDAYGRHHPPPSGNAICIGWSGSITTIQHFDLMLPVFRRLRERYGDAVRFKVIGDGRYREEELGIQGRDWAAATEVRDLSDFDIGVMPLPDDEWARGKCGLKGLQYMALEIPTIMSPVGVNSDIIEDGRNGFLAADEDEWFTKITNLIESAELRRALGTEARRTVEERYSVRSQRDRYVSLLSGLTR
jgi:glycosyltransferase involved in cell wall biosynthesis